jgi:hypothetical protein
LNESAAAVARCAVEVAQPWVPPRAAGWVARCHGPTDGGGPHACGRGAGRRVAGKKRRGGVCGWGRGGRGLGLGNGGPWTEEVSGRGTGSGLVGSVSCPVGWFDQGAFST